MEKYVIVVNNTTTNKTFYYVKNDYGWLSDDLSRATMFDNLEDVSKILKSSDWTKGSHMSDGKIDPPRMLYKASNIKFEINDIIVSVAQIKLDTPIFEKKISVVSKNKYTDKNNDYQIIK